MGEWLEKDLGASCSRLDGVGYSKKKDRTFLASRPLPALRPPCFFAFTLNLSAVPESPSSIHHGVLLKQIKH